LFSSAILYLCDVRPQSFILIHGFNLNNQPSDTQRSSGHLLAIWRRGYANRKPESLQDNATPGAIVVTDCAKAKMAS